MKLIFYSTAPSEGVGYGVLTKYLAHKLIQDGHEVIIATKHGIGKGRIEDGIRCIDGQDIGLVNKIADEENYDYIITAADVWVYPTKSFESKKWVAINFLDVEYIFPKMIENLKEAKHIVAINDHGMRELQRVGFNPFYAPLGTDTKLYCPDDEKRKAFRLKKKWAPDTFVIGLVGLNYSTDRKNIIGLIKAFQGFHKRHPNSKLYLHTDVMGNMCPGVPLQWIMTSCGFENNGIGAIEYADQKLFHMYLIPPDELAELYRAYDVFCLPSKGEGFGMPWLEAQACGTPTITVNTTGGKQFNFGGYVIPDLEDFYKFSTHTTWYVDASPSAIDEQLENAYQDWLKPEVYQKRKEAARAGALEYEWDTVYAKYWKPMLDKLGDRTVTISRLPNYGLEYYEKFTGKALFTNCWAFCKNMDCQKLKPEAHPLLPGEWEGPAPVLQRSYPIVPDVNGKLLVDTSCELYKWLSARFINECQKYWNSLFGYALVRNKIKELWDTGFFKGKYEYVSEVMKDVKFDEGYIKAWQLNLSTSLDFTPEILSKISLGSKILDVGTGDGRRVKDLISKGYDAMGTEINTGWLNDKVVFGDINSLPFPDNSFDLVSNVDVLEHMTDPIKGISELFRVTKNYVLVQVTGTDALEFWEDPTHKAAWDLLRWQRELLEFGEDMIIYKNGVYLLRKKKNDNKSELSKV